MPDNYEYHAGLRASFGLEIESENRLSEEDVRRLCTFYNEFSEKHPSSLTCKRIPLDYLEGDAFVDVAQEYVKGFFLRGIPSLFSDLKPLYSSAEKAKALQLLFEGYCERLTKADCDVDPDLKSNPQSVLWIHHVLAQHYDQMGDTEAALKHVHAALDHTPTVSEVHIVHSKVLKHAGDLPGEIRGCCNGVEGGPCVVWSRCLSSCRSGTQTGLGRPLPELRRRESLFPGRPNRRGRRLSSIVHKGRRSNRKLSRNAMPLV